MQTNYPSRASIRIDGKIYCATISSGEVVAVSSTNRAQGFQSFNADRHGKLFAKAQAAFDEGDVLAHR